MTPKEMAILAAKALDEKKGKEISAIEITDLTTLADYFVIATGTSNTQINALCGAVEKALKEQAGEDPLRREDVYKRQVYVRKQDYDRGRSVLGSVLRNL